MRTNTGPAKWFDSYNKLIAIASNNAPASRHLLFQTQGLKTLSRIWNFDGNAVLSSNPRVGGDPVSRRCVSSQNQVFVADAGMP
jgi:hypothetical protein